MIWRRVILAGSLVLTAIGCGRADVAGDRPVPTRSTLGTTTGRPFTAPETAPTTPPTTPAPTTPATTLAPTTPTTPAPRSFTIAFTGDFLLHDRVNTMAAGHAEGDPSRDHDYRPLLEPIRPWVSGADWAVCHMEVSLSADGTRLSSYPLFRSPGQIAFDAKDLGYDSCTVASNHTLDQGVDGVTETLGVFDTAGLHATGAARSASEASAQRMIDIRGVKVAHLSYTYSFNGFQVPPEAPWTSNLIDEERILADAAEAKLEAEYVVVSLHWGDEYLHRPSRQQRELGPRLLSSDAIDLIVGHHAHVVQPIEQIEGEWLVYGLGNLLSNYGEAVRRDELLVTASVTEQADGRFETELEVVPLYLDYATLTVYPTSPASRPTAIPADLVEQLHASWVRVLAVLDDGERPPRLAIG